ncbi:MAG: ABC transporter ATP-binding protein [Myxococcales bacterium]|nr:ABC transporter ATP-binding protein [Myxococcales bacterium]
MTSPLRRIIGYAAGYRQRLILATLYSVLNKVLDLAPPLLIGLAVDTVVAPETSLLSTYLGMESSSSQLWLIAGLTLVIWGGESATEYLFKICWRNLAQSLQHDMRIAAYEHLQNLDLRYFEDQSSGELMSVLNDDVNQLERFFDVGANEILQLIITVLSIGAFFFAAAPGVAWMAFLPMPIIILGSLRFQRRMAPRYSQVREQVGMLNSQLANNIGGIATIKSFTAERFEIARISKESERYKELNRTAIRLSAAFVPLIRMAIVCGFIATLVYGGHLTTTGQLGVGMYSTLVFMTQRLLWPLTRMGQTLDLYQRAMASSSRIFELLDTPIALSDGETRLPRGAIKGHLRLHDVSFAYHESIPVLSNLDIDVAAGRVTAFVGATGAGKSTLLKLLLRFYETSSGRITLDGLALPDIRLSDLRDAIAFVSQDVFLFHGTVSENIRYGCPEADDESVEAAARAAEAHAFIESLVDGYDTVVGERGHKLSGGQRQRISIARAVLKDSPILILDEATSSVDNETEAAIQQALDRIAKGRTMILIAHRLSTVRNADCIHVLNAGCVVASGTHEQLLGGDGIYPRLWRVQTGARQVENRPKALADRPKNADESRSS